MKLGFQLAHYQRPPGRHLGELAERAEGAGFSSLWVMDHLLLPENLGSPQDPMLEAYCLLGFLAAHCSRMRLGTLVSCCGFRSSLHLLGNVATLHRLSGGRAWLGLGAGWWEREHLAYGIPFAPPAQRMSLLEQVVGAARRQLPDIPLLVGGMGERRTLPLVVAQADACNFFQSAGLESIRRALARIDGLCQQVGRAPGSLYRTTVGFFEPRFPQRGLEELRQLAEAGIDEAIIGLADPWNERHWDLLRDRVVPRVAGF